MKSPVIALRLFAAIAMPLMVAACDEPQGAAAPKEMPPTSVSVVVVKPEPIEMVSELPGRVAPTRIAEVRPRVSGIVVERVFEQGSQVAEGDVLYRIDPASFRVQVESAEATLQRAEAVQVQARQDADRQKALIARNATSGQQRDNAIAALAQADADVAAAQAGLAAAKLNLQYADVRAPIAGRIGRALITEGALVSSTVNLATVQQLDPVYVDFTQSSAQLRRLRQALESGALDSPAPGEARVRIRMDDGTEYERPGRLLFSEATVDPTTGQVTLRAEVPNPDGDLLPGLYVRVLIEQAVERNAIAIPQQAIQRDPGGEAQVLVVNGKDIAEMRRVRVSRAIGDRYVIDEGLSAGDRVVVEGFQKVRPGARVSAEAWQPAKDAASEAERKPSAG